MNCQMKEAEGIKSDPMEESTNSTRASGRGCSRSVSDCQNDYRMSNATQNKQKQHRNVWKWKRVLVVL